MISDLNPGKTETLLLPTMTWNVSIVLSLYELLTAEKMKSNYHQKPLAFPPPLFFLFFPTKALYDLVILKLLLA